MIKGQVTGNSFEKLTKSVDKFVNYLGNFIHSPRRTGVLSKLSKQ